MSDQERHPIKNPFIDDEVEEDDDEEEEEEEEEDRRPAKRPRNRYIEDEAAVDDDEEDFDDEDADLVQEDGFIAEDIPEEEARAAGDDRANRRLDQMRRQQDDKSAEEIAAEFKARYARTRPTESDFSEVPQRMLMPSVDDPSIWSVRCKMGREKNIVMTIMLKCFASSSTKPMGIISAFCRDSLPGRIFVEARRLDHVVSSLDDITGVYTSSGAFLVPIEEMADLLKITKQQREIKAGSWVRIKRGRYAGDLAQVLETYDNGEEVGVKFVPRIDLNPREEGTYIDNAGRKRRKNPNGGQGMSGAALAFRPPPRFFNYDEVAKAYRHRPPQLKGKGKYTFMNDDYVRGYCEKDLKVNALVLDGVNPTLDEISKFMGETTTESLEKNNVNLGLLKEATTNDAQQDLFHPGDHVSVLEGEQAGARGIVSGIVGSVLQLTLDDVSLTGQTVEVPITAARKAFREGDQVKVIAGVHAGETGMVTAVEDGEGGAGSGVVTFLADLTKVEVRVFAKDIRAAADVGSAANTIGGYELHEMVQLDAATAGVIVQIEPAQFRVLDTSGQVRAVRATQIAGKRDTGRSTAIDSTGEQLNKGDVVREVDGERRHGTVLHIFSGAVVYLFNRDVNENGGVFLARPKNLAPRFYTGKKGPDLTKMNPQRQTAVPPPQVANFTGRGRDPLRGKHVAIRRGPYKTYRGIITETLANNSVRVELQNTAKTLTVELDNLLGKDPNTGQSYRLLHNMPGPAAGGSMGPPSMGGAPMPGVPGVPISGVPPRYGAGGMPTPGVPPRTPGFAAGATPAYGGRTPGYGAGGKTPAFGAGGRTPAYGAVGARTPAYGMGARTPAYGTGMRTPAYGAGSRTPAYGGGQTPAYTGARTPAYGGNRTPAYSGGRTPAYAPAPTPYDTMDAVTPFAAPTPGAAPTPYVAPTPGAAPTPAAAPTPGAGLLDDDGYTPAVGPAPIVQDDEDEGPDAPLPSARIYVRARAGGSTFDALTEHDGDQASVSEVNEAQETCTIALDSGAEVSDVPFQHAEPVRPKVGNLCLVLNGEMRGSRATLKGIDSGDAMIVMSTGRTEWTKVHHLALLG